MEYNQFYLFFNKPDQIKKERKLQSLHAVKKCVIEPAEKLLTEQSVTKDFSLRETEQIRLYLEFSKAQLRSLNEALCNNRCASSSIATDAEKTVDILKEMIPSLEERLQTYRQSVKEENKKVGTSFLEKGFHGQKSFESLINEILVVYDDPVNNFHYGRKIRNILIDLTRSDQINDVKILNQHIKQCEVYIADIECCLQISKFEVHTADFKKVQNSVLSLLKLLQILKTK